MKEFNNLLKKFDLNFLGNGKYKIAFDKAIELKNENRAFIIDVRTKEENDYMKFDFAENIPLSEIPDRIEEIPKDKIIVLFCVSSTRSSIAYTYLKLLGYENVKIVANGVSEIVGFIKPGFILKNSQK